MASFCRLLLEFSTHFLVLTTIRFFQKSRYKKNKQSHMSKKLEKIREKIDKLDNQIHDLLMERADLVSDVAAEKRKHNLQIVHPAREAMMVRRLLKRHKSVLPEAAVVRIWR